MASKLVRNGWRAVGALLWMLALGLGAVPAPADFRVAPLVAASGPSPLADCDAEVVLRNTVFWHSEVEPWLVVDPTDPDHLAAVWTQDQVFGDGALGSVVGVSFDGGATWESVVVPGQSECTGGSLDYAIDPWLTFASNGDLYYFGFSWDDPPSNRTEVLVSKSTDGGLTWGPSLTLDQGIFPDGLWQDKTSIAADPTHDRFVYAIWTECENALCGTANTRFSRTTDAGISWEPPRTIYDPGDGKWAVGHQILVLPDGTLVALFVEGEVGPVQVHIALQRSPDRGATWLPVVRGPATQPLNPFEPDTFREVLSAGNRGILPDFAVDAATGSLYAVWQDTRFGFSPQVAFAMSTDGGLSWSTPVAIAQTPSSPNPALNQSFTPAVAVASDGTVGVSYYDFRHDALGAPALTDRWFIHCRPAESDCTDPASWQELRLTPSSFDVLQAPVKRTLFLGDYMGWASDGRDFLALFGQSSVEDSATLYFARIEASEFEVGIDIKSGSCPNSYNRSSNGVLPVAVVGSEDLDVSQIDSSTVLLSRVDNVGSAVAPILEGPGPKPSIEDVATPLAGEACDCHELEGDGILDLSLKFKTQQVVEALLLDDLPAGALPELIVSGNLLDGTPFEGSDCVRLVPPGTSSARTTVQGSSWGAWVEVSPLDDTLDGGGFVPFTRSFPETTEVTLTASSTHYGMAFRGWRIDGGALIPDATIGFAVEGEHFLEAVYQSAGRRCGLAYELALLLPPLFWLYRRRRLLTR